MPGNPGVGNGAGRGGAGPAAMPGAATPGQPGRRGGIAIDFRRGRTSKARLTIDWTYPVWKPETPAGREPQPGGTTATPQREHALGEKAAYELVASDDKRPLLVLRECELCKGTDHALLSRDLDNEQTVLLAHWFRCVKLPTNVLQPDHPLHALFAPAQPGERIPHLFFADPDGANRTTLPGDQSQAQLWDVMFSFLDRCYEGDAKKAVKELRTLLSQFDRIDGMEEEVKARIDREIEKNGPGTEKAARYEADLKKLEKEREQLLARERKIRDLALATARASERPAAPQDAPGEARR